MITVEEMKKIAPFANKAKVELFTPLLNDAMKEFDIDNPMREAAFLAQVAHESGGFHYVKEIASGAAYEGRKDLGNTEPGDGIFYKGRGLIQITGRANYDQCGQALDLPLIEQPELLEQPVNACRSAAWFWKSRGLNDLADKGDFKLITKRINGGLNGYPDRLAYYERAQETLGA